jgi:hypothetical protein
MVMNGKLESARKWKVAFMSYFEILFGDPVESLSKTIKIYVIVATDLAENESTTSTIQFLDTAARYCHV